MNHNKNRQRLRWKNNNKKMYLKRNRLWRE